MLQVTDIRENKEKYVKALAKRGIDAASTIEEVLKADEERRASQAQLDEVLAQSNSYSKEIGKFFKSGEVQKANELKEKTVELKESSKQLNEQMLTAAEKLQQLLYTLPNIPNELVPAGTDENDNEEVFKEGEIPKLIEGALPHWELAKKIRFNRF
jgi:seryl-tRNA synthetase